MINSLQHPVKQLRINKLFKEIMDSGYYSEGKQTEEAEEALVDQTGCPTLLFNSCGSALYTAFRYYSELGYKQAVMQSNTFYATGQMALEAGITPVLCDSRPDCPSMSADSMVEALKASGAKLVVLTHIGGWLAKDYSKIAAYCVSNNLILMEDCAHCFGVSGAGKLGHTACWSFYSTKAVPVGEAGALSTCDAGLFIYASRFRSYGKVKTPRAEAGIEYRGGMNLRVSEWAAAVLRVQLGMLPLILQYRKNDAQKLQSIAPCVLTGETNWYKYPVPASYSKEYQTVGHVYKRSDQLDVCIPTARKPVPLNNSHHWAHNCCSLPVGEDSYELYNSEELKKVLCRSEK